MLIKTGKLPVLPEQVFFDRVRSGQDRTVLQLEIFRFLKRDNGYFFSKGPTCRGSFKIGFERAGADLRLFCGK